MTYIENAVEALREALQRASMQEAVAQEASDREAQRGHQEDVDRLRAALRALGGEYPPMDPRPWSTLEGITSDLWTALDPSPERVAEGIRPKCDLPTILGAVEAAHRALGEVEAVPDRLPIDTTGQFLTAVLDGLGQLQREAAEIHRGALELGEDLERLLGRDGLTPLGPK
jgi:hypothetical protein